jgi:hypothetical protein
MITYSTNWMGPINVDWYRQRGLTKTKTVVQEEDSKYTDRKKGDIYEIEEITQQWCGGRIDVRGEGLGPYGEELGLPIMRGDSYNLFSDWLDTFETDDVWTLAQLVELYERANPKIVWAKDVFKYNEGEKNK